MEDVGGSGGGSGDRVGEGGAEGLGVGDVEEEEGEVDTGPSLTIPTSIMAW